MVRSLARRGMPAVDDASSLDPRLSLTFQKHVKKKLRTYDAPAPMAPIADTHAHLTCFWGKDPAHALARAALAGDRLLITLLDPLSDGLGVEEFHAKLEGWVGEARGLVSQALAQGAPAMAFEGEFAELDAPDLLFGRVRYLAGAHPYGAAEYTDVQQAQLEQALSDPLCAGIGEIGLDYHFDAVDNVEVAPHDLQIACLERQLALAVERDVPVELHLRHEDGDERRESHEDAYRVLRNVGVPRAGCVLHCFGEDRATMERFVELGCHIAFGGAATFRRNEQVREAFVACPKDRILFETDCPYMAPEPLRGSECEPAMITFTVDALVRDRANRTGEDPHEIAAAAWVNARQLFGL